MKGLILFVVTVAVAASLALGQGEIVRARLEVGVTVLA